MSLLHFQSKKNITKSVETPCTYSLHRLHLPCTLFPVRPSGWEEVTFKGTTKFDSVYPELSVTPGEGGEVVGGMG